MYSTNRKSLLARTEKLTMKDQSGNRGPSTYHIRVEVIAKHKTAHVIFCWLKNREIIELWDKSIGPIQNLYSR